MLPAQSPARCITGRAARAIGRPLMGRPAHQQRSKGSSVRVPPCHAAILAPESTADNTGQLDLYSILGISPFADAKEVKKAYLNMLRQYHPDHNAEILVEATQLCTLLNEIYETLSNPESRATYDALAGFSTTAVNPFMDSSFAADHVFVDEVTCIGCGLCCRQACKTFAIEESLYGRARVIQQGADSEEDVQIAKEMCPVDCIHHVSLPQLGLLEAALSTMQRIDVFVLRRGLRKPGDVFETAARAWQKRRSAILARAESFAAPAQSTSSSGSLWNLWGMGAASTTNRDAEEAANYGSASTAGGDEEEKKVGNDPTARRVAKLAAAAARAARMWRVYSSTQVVRVLSDSSSGSEAKTAEGQQAAVLL